MGEVVGTVVVDEQILTVRRIRMDSRQLVLDAEAVGPANITGGLVECEMFGIDGFSLGAMRLNLPRLKARRGDLLKFTLYLSLHSLEGA